MNGRFQLFWCKLPSQSPEQPLAVGSHHFAVPSNCTLPNSVDRDVLAESVRHIIQKFGRRAASTNVTGRSGDRAETAKGSENGRKYRLPTTLLQFKSPWELSRRSDDTDFLLSKVHGRYDIQLAHEATDTIL